MAVFSYIYDSTQFRESCTRICGMVSSVVPPGVDLQHMVWGGVAVGVGLAAWAVPTWWNRYRGSRDKILKKRNVCRRTIEDLRRRMKLSKVTAIEREAIVGLSLEELIDGLQNGDLKALDVLHAYQQKALEVHDKTNCLIQPVENAEHLARRCDESIDTLGPLHGVPVSIKDHCGIKGYVSTIGCSKYISQPFPEDAVLVQVLKEQGAIPFVKTNVPTALLSFETTNPIFGRTVNPHKVSHGCGGSSGGEGALLAGGGSPLGIGSDIGGSIRIPAHMCGIAGIKPTYGRLSSKGTHPFGKGQKTVQGSQGPMGRDVESLVIAMRSLLAPRMTQLDQTLSPLPFRDEIYLDKKKLRIGFYVDDGYFTAVPACQRAVYEAKEVLEKQGYEVVPWDIRPHVKVTVPLWSKVVFADGGKNLFSAMGNDPLDESTKNLSLILRLPNVIRNILAFIMDYVFPQVAVSLRSTNGLKSVADFWEVTAQIEKLRQTVIGDWNNFGLDAVICPGFPFPALPFGTAPKVFGGFASTLVYNVFNFTAGSVPVTKVTHDDVINMEKFYPRSNPWEKILHKCSAGAEGLPVNVQVVTLPFQEELCLRVMKNVENGIRERGNLTAAKRSI